MLEFQNIYNLINNEKLFLLEDITQPFIDDIELANYNLLNEELIQVDISDSEKNQIDILLKKISEIDDALNNKDKIKIDEFYKKIKINLGNDSSSEEQIINTKISNILKKLEKNTKDIHEILKNLQDTLQKKVDGLKDKLRKSINNKKIPSDIKYIVCPQAFIYPTGSIYIGSNDDLYTLLTTSKNLTSSQNIIAKYIGNVNNLSSYAFISFVGGDSGSNVTSYINSFKTYLKKYGSDVIEIDWDDNITYKHDFKPTSKKMYDLLRFIIENKNKTFIINCKAGEVRSNTLAILTKYWLSNLYNIEGQIYNLINKKGTNNILVEYFIPCAYILNGNKKQFIQFLSDIFEDKDLQLSGIKFKSKWGINSETANKFKHDLHTITQKHISDYNHNLYGIVKHTSGTMKKIIDKLDTFYNEKYDKTKNIEAYYHNMDRGKEGFVRPSHVIPNRIKKISGATTNGADINRNFNLEPTVYQNILKYCGGICKSSKKLNLPSYDYIITMKSSTKELFANFLNLISSSINPKCKIISYEDTYTLTPTLSSNIIYYSDKKGNKQPLIVKKEGKFPSGTVRTLWRSDQASKDNKKATIFDNEQIFKNSITGKTSCNFLIIDDDIEKGKSFIQVAVMIRDLCAQAGVNNVTVNALALFTTGINGSSDIINEAAGIQAINKYTKGVNDFDIVFNNNLSSIPPYTKNYPTDEIYLMYNNIDDVIDYATDIKYKGNIVINKIYTCFILNHTLIKQLSSKENKETLSYFDSSDIDNHIKQKQERRQNIIKQKQNIIKQNKEKTERLTFILESISLIEKIYRSIININTNNKDNLVKNWEKLKEMKNKKIFKSEILGTHYYDTVIKNIANNKIDDFTKEASTVIVDEIKKIGNSISVKMMEILEQYNNELFNGIKNNRDKYEFFIKNLKKIFPIDINEQNIIQSLKKFEKNLHINVVNVQ